MKITERYKLNKTLKVGQECICPTCGSKFIKTQHQQAFCRTRGKTVCKDGYHNKITPHKRNNTTRISPASARFINSRIYVNDYYDYGWDGHKDTF